MSCSVFRTSNGDLSHDSRQFKAIFDFDFELNFTEVYDLKRFFDSLFTSFHALRSRSRSEVGGAEKRLDVIVARVP